MPKYSFILPAYKRQYFQKSIESVFHQTYADLELIIVDDSSPEDLQSVLKQFKDDRIKYYRNQENIGSKNLVQQWNHCLEYAQGEYVILAADDDMYSTTFLEEIDALTHKYPDVDLLRSRVLQIDEKDNPLWDDGNFEEYQSKYKYLHDWLEGGMFTCIGNYVFRRSALMKKGGFMYFPCAFGSDIATPIALSKNGVAHTKEMLFKFRQSTIHLSDDKSKFVEKLAGITQLSEWLMSIDYEQPTEPKDIEAYSIKNNQYLHQKVVYDYFNLVIKNVPFVKLYYYLKQCKLATNKDKTMMVLRWFKRRIRR